MPLQRYTWETATRRYRAERDDEDVATVRVADLYAPERWSPTACNDVAQEILRLAELVLRTNRSLP